MNALFLEKLIEYRKKHRLDVAKKLIAQKISNQFVIIHQRKLSFNFIHKLSHATTTQKILLIEARAAKKYWSLFGSNLKHQLNFRRKPHTKDRANILLDIGYHFLASELIKICITLKIPTELGFFHTAQSARAQPLVYDFMEWLRPIVVDRIVLKKFRQSKKTIATISQKDVGRLINSVKSTLNKTYFNKEFGYCITLHYWITLIFLKFEHSVNNDIIFDPVFPSMRHESRCKNTKRKPPVLPTE